MSYLVVATIDLKNGSNYECVNEKFEALGLKKRVNLEGSDIELAHNTYIGKFEAANSTTLRDELFNKTLEALKSCGEKGKVFIAVGTGWAWDQKESDG